MYEKYILFCDFSRCFFFLVYISVSALVMRVGLLKLKKEIITKREAKIRWNEFNFVVLGYTRKIIWITFFLGIWASFVTDCITVPIQIYCKLMYGWGRRRSTKSDSVYSSIYRHRLTLFCPFFTDLNHNLLPRIFFLWFVGLRKRTD